jgi:hypothetical protein
MLSEDWVRNENGKEEEIVKKKKRESLCNPEACGDGNHAAGPVAACVVQ